MAKARRVRWECPSAKHPAVLASTRPLADATARFCLPCSEETGRLVKRVAPALEAKRERAAAKTKVKQQSKRERERAAARRKRFAPCLEPDGSAGEVDVKRTLERMMRLPAVKAALRDDRALWLADREIEFELRHHTSPGCGGRAWSRALIQLGVGPGCPRQQVEELILHELCHYVLPRSVAHGQRFRSLLMAAAREWFPGVRPVWEGRVYRMDAKIWRDAWRLADGCAGEFADHDEDDEEEAR